MQIFKKLFFLLNTYERKLLGLLLLMILLMALVDMIGVASVLPFIAVLTNPSLIETNFILNFMFETSKIVGVENHSQFIFLLGIFFLILLLTSLTLKATTIYATVRFSEMRHYSINKRLVEGYLRQPYSWFLNQNSSELKKTILSEVGNVAVNGFTQMLEVISKGAIVIALLSLLIIVDPKLAITAGITIGGAYGLIYYSLANYLKGLGEERLLHNELRFRWVSEAFNAAKAVKVSGLEQSYTNRFSNSSIIYAKTTTSSEVIKQLPRFFLEAIVFGGILLMILYTMKQAGSFNSALPILSLYVFAGYRLMPALQQVYASLTILKFIGPSVEKLHEDIKSLNPLIENQSHEVMPLNNTITLKNIYYNYPNTSRTAINGINLNIPAKSTVGFIGITGSGKTTVVDIILGLLEVQKGTLEVDGKVITKQNSRSWQRSIGYVPQHIYLADDTVAANIAFGLETKDINEVLIEKAAKIANLHQFVIDELPNQYQTIVGENGVRLSGGQRQRIGIARALYNNPQLLILDEATSSLDTETELSVMEAINNLSKEITIILIAHRLNTVKNCDIIFQLDKGQLIRQGKFNEIIGASK